jgi:LacI family transcriptional regulator, galactose operon repressor
VKIRIKDIARLAQVSTGTVDRVIHARGEVSEETRNKVNKILKDLNYQKDILASSLASRRSYLFSVLLPVSANDNEFWNAPNLGIEKAKGEISPFGVNIKIYKFDQYDSKSFVEQCDVLLSDSPDAVLLAPIFVEESKKFLLECHLRAITVTLINSNIEKAEKLSFIGQNAFTSGMLGAKLLSYGMRQDGDLLILNIPGRKHNQNHLVTRERGFRTYFEETNHHVFNLRSIELEQFYDKSFYTKMDNAFNNFRVKGIFVTNSRVYRAVDYLIRNNLNDIRIVGYDLIPKNIEYLKEGKIDFLISQKPEEQGYKGIMSLFNFLLLNKSVESTQYLPIDILTKENIEYYEYR